MKRKKIVVCTIFALLLLTLSACGGGSSSEGSSPSANVEGELTDLFAKIYSNAGVDAPGTLEVPLDDSNKAAFIGTNEVSFTEGLASEAAIMTIPHSMVLLRIDQTADAEKVKQLIKDNVDPRKWICTGVEEDQVIVDNIGNLVFLVMSIDAEAYHKSFLQLAG